MAILTCPECTSSFRIDPSKIPAEGRAVRCHKCKHIWTTTHNEMHLEEGEELVESVSAHNVAEDFASMESPEDQSSEDQSSKDQSSEVESPRQEASVQPTVEEQSDIDTGDASQEEGSLDKKTGQSSESVSSPAQKESALEDETQQHAKEQQGEKSSLNLNPASDEENMKKVAQAINKKQKGSHGAGGSVLMYLLLMIASVVVGGTAAGYYFRFEVAEMYPGTRGVYQLAGVNISDLGMGLELTAPTAVDAGSANNPVLQISGTIFNTRRQEVTIPLLYASLLDSNGKEVQMWVFKAEKEKIGPSEVVSYQSQMANPHLEARTILVTFISEEEVVSGNYEVQ